ncbi:MAG: VOC family protein [Flavobacteriales bacterium]|nr:VOC family protein [Flavobacteriales bacterium]
MPEFDIAFLDHVAIRVKDMKASAAWYQKVLGLKRYETPEWGPFPIFLLANKSGIALFPANENDPVLDPSSRNVRIDHFAFHVSPEDFDKARAHYEKLGLDFEVKNHTYFRSIYTLDPDGHTVELTSLQVAADSFYA